MAHEAPGEAPLGVADEDEPSWGFGAGSDVDETLVAIGLLGGGSRYEVLRCFDRRLFCEAAVKLIRPNRVNDERALAGFTQEAALGLRLVHPNLVRLLRWSPAPLPYLVLEYVGAATLGDHVADNDPLKVPEVCLLGIRMASALHYLHANAVLHLDVKPDNVTLGDPPRLLDLGLARTAPGPIRLAHAVGTAAYMPPEQCLKEALTERSDIFSLGATLYEGVSAMIPFPPGDDASSERTRRYPQLVEPPQPLADVADVPRSLERIVMACLARDPDGRPPSARAVALALHGVLEELGVSELYAWPKGLRVTTG